MRALDDCERGHRLQLGAASRRTAYFKCVNDNGGINGRPIDYAYEDDALNQQKAAQIAAQFADDKSVVALAGDATFIGCGAANPIYKKANLYSITGTGVPQSCFESSNIAPVNAGPRISAVATMQYLHRQGKADRGRPGLEQGARASATGCQAGVEDYAKAEAASTGRQVDPARPGVARRQLDRAAT